MRLRQFLAEPGKDLEFFAEGVRLALPGTDSSEIAMSLVRVRL